MKNFIKVFGIATLIAVIGFSMAACGEAPDPTDNVPGTPAPLVFSGTANGETYTLTITQSPDNRAAFTPKSGDAYVLKAGTKTSSGTVTAYSNGEFTLKPEGATATFTAKTSSEGISGFTGSITFDGESTPTTLPTEVTPTPPPPSGGPKVTGAQVYTLDEETNTFTAYAGTGSAQDVTLRIGLATGDSTDEGTLLGKVGTISGDGKLSFELPASVADDKLFLLPEGNGGDGVTKLVTASFNVSSTGNLELCHSTKESTYVSIMYVDRDATLGGVSAKKGWNYLEMELGDNGPTSQHIITDISNHKWVIY